MKEWMQTYSGAGEEEEKSSRAVLREILLHVRSKRKGFFLFCGKHYRGPVVAAAIYPVLEGGIVVVVDGGNMFDPYVISRVARMIAVPPKDVLSRFFISRAFTCYQVESLIVSRLPGFIKEKQPVALIVTGLLETFYDSDVPLKDAASLFRRTVKTLLAFSRKIPVMVVSPLPPSAGGERGCFFDRLLKKADAIYTPGGEVITHPLNKSLQRGRDL